MGDPDELELFEAIMGWDGELCDCSECLCRRFIDEPKETWCRDCRAGRHWLETGDQGDAER